MEIHARGREKGPLVALVLALIVLGLGSLYLTWRSIAQQRQVVEDHLVMTGSSILRGVENNLLRLVRSIRLNPSAAPMFSTLATDLFTELAKSEDIDFVMLTDMEGAILSASVSDGVPPKLEIPPRLTGDLEPGRAWHLMFSINKRDVLVSGVRTRPSLALMALGETPPPVPDQSANQHGRGPGHMRGQGHGMGRGMGQGMMQPEPANAPPVFLLVGINAEKNMAQFRQYRRAALYQTGYVFLAAIVLWSLAFAYLNRRDQSRKLVRMEQFQNKLLDNMPDGLLTLSASGEILAANHSAKLLLAPRDQEKVPEIIGRNWQDFFIGMQAVEGSGTAPYEWEQFDYQGRQLEILSLPFQEAEESEPEQGLRMILVRDRTEIRSLEENLNEAKRLAAIGSLAAGVAHEVRNPLSSLRGFAQLFANKLKGQKPLDEYAATMVQEADRLNRVVTDLLYLAKPRQLAPVRTNLPEVAESLCRLMRFDFESREVLPEFDFQADTVCADQDAFRQVLLNLISNSLDAIGGDESREEPGSVRLVSHQDKDGIWVIVEDNGPGMPEEIRAEALKPFVTGKKTGTGLGLAIVQNIMRAHRGRVEIESAPGKGTSVKLLFPHRCDKEVS
ncbi:two-component system sensor histidine kinase NtrB [Pseudodesulfovibrio tunisiensis]|uniref:two-component system sensor histidine kinase NtrB n=1 Tax=Pseudodesulfovibrio tunisiensis TaxID=463192 RepID=UPI001FB43BD0|nr:ATP-binding protein [Pseudodesulfovibrio tunisiensis]